MCGIVGVLSARGPVEPSSIERMVAAIEHRGPDDRGFEQVSRGETECWLGNTRLSIIDLSSAGHMPMRDEGSRNWITYNGETYNFPQLRSQLAALGEKFVSKTDTEVILRLYRREGVRCLDRLRGMYAFAIWDAGRRELFLARDRAGKKPFYYASPRPGVFVFASEVRALLAGGLVEARIDPEGLDIYLANGFLVSPVTLLRGVRSLLPGHFMRVAEDGSVQETACYWRPPRGSAAAPEATEETLEECREVFREAVSLRLISDVPLSIFLSGGMDSSAVVGFLGKSGADLRTFSVSFPDSECDESPHSRRIAEVWKTRHTEVPMDTEQFFAWLPGALGAMDQPTFDGVNTYLVSRAARAAGLKVAITGLGADELFGGYPFFKAAPLLSAVAPAMAMVPRGASSWLEGLAYSSAPEVRVTYSWNTLELLRARGEGGRQPGDAVLAAYQVAQILFPPPARRALLGGSAESNHEPDVLQRLGLPGEFVEFVRDEIDGLDRHTALSLATWRLFLGERCLRDVDAMSMGVSLEVRAPFTDHLFIERVLRFPGRMRCAGAPDKPFERRLLNPWLREAWSPRPKQGFVMPFRKWLGSPRGRETMEASFADARLLERAGLRPQAVVSLWRAHLSDPARVPWSRVWAIYALTEWCRRTGARV